MEDSIRRVRRGDGSLVLRDWPTDSGDGLGGPVVAMDEKAALERAERFLLDSEERFRRDAGGGLDDAVFMIAPDGTLATWNAGAERMNGWRADEVLGQPTTRFYTDEDVRAGRPQMSLEVAKRNGRVEDEGWRLRRDGTRFWASVVVTAVRDARGALRGFAMVTRDTSERRRLLDDAQRHAELLQLSDDAILVWRLDGGIETWNRGAEALYGFALEEAVDRVSHVLLGTVFPCPLAEVETALRRLLGHGLDDLQDADRDPRNGIVRADGSPLPEDEQPAIVALRTGEVVRDVEIGVPTRDGGRRWLLTNARPVVDEQGRRISAVASFFDITDRRDAKDALERSREGLASLARASIAVMASTDVQRLLQATAEGALALTGARFATAGHGWVDGRLQASRFARAPGAPDGLSAQMIRAEIGGVFGPLLEGASSIRFTDQELRADGRWRGLPEGHVPLRGLLGVRLVGASGRTDGVILASDKAHGEFTPEDESLLQQLGTVASLALQHIEARLSLEEADRRKDEFLAMLSHELRNPLTPIRNSLYILRRVAPDGEPARRAKSVIERQTEHLTKLVDDLLDVTRITRGKVRLQREPLDLVDVVRCAAEDQRATISARGLTLDFVAPPAPIRIDADRTRVTQVVGNLLQNAGKFTTAPGKITVEVEADEWRHMAVIRVRDTGVGIPADMLPHVFEPFTQGETTLDRSKGGLGLGLAFVKAFVELHGGGVGVQSAGAGAGAAFTVSFPLARESATASAVSPSIEGHAAGQRVLVVDDNVDAGQTLRELLELDRCVVELASSGPEGIEKARAFRPDVVFCDLGLPGMDGYAVARALRAEPSLAATRLVALSGYAAPEDVRRAAEAGFDTHLAKPVSVAAIARAMVPADAGPRARAGPTSPT